MTIDPSAVGFAAPAIERSWGSKDALLYALGVGAGNPDPLTELHFTTENSAGVTQQVLPTFACLFGAAGTGVMDAIGPYDSAMLVHAGQAIELHRPIPVDGHVRVECRVAGIYDKGSGALVVTESRSFDVASGEPMFTNRSSAFIRGEGGFGGERGPSSTAAMPEGQPDYEVTYATRPEQALLYRLSGDRNPLHSDPSFARRAGFDRPILHGLCTYGVTGRALVHVLCGGDASRLRTMEARFSKPVFPGSSLRVSVWRVADGVGAFQVRVGDDVVLDGGTCTYAT